MKATTTTVALATTCATLVVLGFGAIEACSSSNASSPGAEGDSGSSIANANDAGATCAAYAAAQCQFISRCEPGTLSGTYGTLSQCQTVQETDCMVNLGAPGSAWTESWTSACSTELGGYAAVCVDAGGPVTRPVPVAGACTLSGAGDAGAPCGVNSQCATGTCDRIGAVCGVCTAPGALGQPCGPGTGMTCAPGLACGSQNLCVTVVGVGSPCDRGATTGCVGGADCVVASSDAGTSGTCVAEGIDAGVACDPQGIGAPNCWDVAGFFCTDSKQCEPIAYAGSGASCGEADGGGSDTACSGGTCVGASCAAPAALSQACTVGNGAGCTAGTVCAVSGSGAGCTAVNAGCFGGEAGPPPFTFSPSNVSLTTILDQSPSAVDENISSSCSVDTDATSPDDDCFMSPIEAVTQEDGSTVDLVVVQSLTLQSTGSIAVSGGVPLIIASLTTITVLGGNIQANSAGLSIGPGGGAGAGSTMAGGGPGGGMASSASTAVGGSGGSFCGLGGRGGGGTSTGAAYGQADIRPLVGGSGGGGGTVGSGAGGGGIQLVAGESIDLGASSYITVGGQGGPIAGLAAGQNAGGGGSGGSILLEAPAVTVAGTLAANGGGGGGDYSTNGGQDGLASATAANGGAAGSSAGAGGDGSAGTTLSGSPGSAPADVNAGGGGGGAGRIRINSSTSAATLTGSTVSPALATRCATQGFLRPLTDGP